MRDFPELPKIGFDAKLAGSLGVGSTLLPNLPVDLEVVLSR
jgi:hypothetical protein